MSNGIIAVAFTALINEDGTLFNKSRAVAPLSSAREYDTIPARFWDKYIEKEKGALWCTVLEKNDSASKYKLSEKLTNVIEGTGLQVPRLPLSPAFDPSEFEISENGILLAAVDVELPPNTTLPARLWYIEIDNYTAPPTKTTKITIPGFDGTFNSPRFSLDGKSHLLRSKTFRLGSLRELVT